MMTIEYLFVYGSLCRQADGSLHPLFGNDAEYLSDAYLPGKLYEVDGYPGAITSPQPTRSIVHGELYHLHNPNLLFQRLDAYEECAAHFPQPHEYRRIAEIVTTDTNREVTAWIYVYNHSLTGRRLIPSGDYRRFKQQDKPT
jgi:gamma-glutamylcyclotransferase (GGCT)/AIG2-like uncharacterized protein YtfP